MIKVEWITKDATNIIKKGKNKKNILPKGKTNQTGPKRCNKVNKATNINFDVFFIPSLIYFCRDSIQNFHDFSCYNFAPYPTWLNRIRVAFMSTHEKSIDRDGSLTIFRG